MFCRRIVQFTFYKFMMYKYVVLLMLYLTLGVGNLVQIKYNVPRPLKNDQ